MGNQQSTPEEEKRIERRKRIAEEILLTEQNYVASLDIVTQLYMIPLVDSLKTPKPILTEAELKGLFAGLNSIMEFHTKILKPEIHARVERWDASRCLGDVFVKHSDMLKIYTLYVNNYDGIHEKVQTFSKRKEFKAFLVEAKKSPRHTQMDLMSYLIMPIQRIPRYVLLLSDLLKFTDPSHPDHKNLTEAVAKVEGVARFINEKKREDESAKKLIAIHKSIEGRFEDPLIQPHRRFILEGSLELVKAQIRAPPKEPAKQQPQQPQEEKKRFTLFSWKGSDKKVHKEGFLFKEGDSEESMFDFVFSLGGFVSNWKKRYFILDGVTLSYFLEEVTGKETSPPEVRGQVDFTVARLLTNEEKKARSIPDIHIAIETRPNERVLVIQQTEEKVAKEWIAAFNNAIELGKKQSSQPASPAPSPSTSEPDARIAKEPSSDLVDATKTLNLPLGRYYVFLFNDLIVQCTDKGSKTYRLKESYPIREAHQIFKTGADTFVYDMEGVFLHFKDSPENVDAWVKALQTILNELAEDKKNRLAFESRPTSIWGSVSSFFA